MKAIVVTAIMATAIIFPACVTEPITPDLSALGEFPISVGSRWTYAVFDSLTLQRDTVMVSVDRRTVSPGGDTVYHCTYRHQTFSDTSFVTVNADTVVFATDQAPPVNLIFPLVIGVTWKYGPSYSVFIAAIEPDTVPSGVYDTTIEVEEQSLLPNDLSRYDYWFAQGVGIVEFNDRTFVTVDNRRRNETWRLLSYAIAH